MIKTKMKQKKDYLSKAKAKTRQKHNIGENSGDKASQGWETQGLDSSSDTRSQIRVPGFNSQLCSCWHTP